jgi:peptide/nickel transport system permease protein
MLGTIGLFIMVMFVWMAILGRFDLPLLAAQRRFRAPPGGARAPALDGHRFVRPRCLERIVHGARISLAVGIGATVLGSSIGVIVGLTFRLSLRLVDLLFQRVTTFCRRCRLLVLALVMTAALGPSLPNVIIAIAIPLIPTVARVIRANTLALA